MKKLTLLSKYLLFMQMDASRRIDEIKNQDTEEQNLSVDDQRNISYYTGMRHAYSQIREIIET